MPGFDKVLRRAYLRSSEETMTLLKVFTIQIGMIVLKSYDGFLATLNRHSSPPPMLITAHPDLRLTQSIVIGTSCD